MKQLEDYNEATLKESFTLINFLHFNLGGGLRLPQPSVLMLRCFFLLFFGGGGASGFKHYSLLCKEEKIISALQKTGNSGTEDLLSSSLLSDLSVLSLWSIWLL